MNLLNPTIESLNNKLVELENSSISLEFEIASRLKLIRNETDQNDPCLEWRYEVMAFSFCENYQEKNTGWGTFFGPMMSSVYEDGTVHEFPSITQVDKLVLDYWRKRSTQTSNVLFKARYAGLVWDLSKRSTGESPNFNFAVDCIESLLIIAEKGIHKYNLDIVNKLERALSISLAISKKELIEKVKNAIFKFESNVTDDTKTGLWGISFDLLVENKKVELTEEEIKSIIGTLEERFLRLQSGFPLDCERAANRLVKYYLSKSDNKEVRRVINDLGLVFERSAEKDVPLVAESWLEHVLLLYYQFNLKESAERVAKIVRTIGPLVKNNMRTACASTDISKEDFEKIIAFYTKDNLEDSFSQVAIYYIPSKNYVENQVKEISKAAPISYLVKNYITDYDGRFIASIGPLVDDPDGHIVRQISQNMHINSVFLNEVFERIFKKFNLTSNDIITYLFCSPVFIEKQRIFLVEGLDAYFIGKYSIAIHLIVPQIESAFRTLLEKSGSAVLKPSRRGGGFQLITFDELLRDKSVSSALREDAAFYLRILFTDPRGWNIRNDVCHGIIHHQHASKKVADRLIHVLLLLAELREDK